MADQTDPETQRVADRAELLPEEQAAGSEDPRAQAEAILEESDERTASRDAAPDSRVEHRTSDEVTDDAAAGPDHQQGSDQYR